MSGIRSITRRAYVAGSTSASVAPVYVDSDDNRLKVLPLGSGTTTEVILEEAGGASLGEVLTGARTLTAVDSGKTFFLALATGFAVTLPSPAVGLNFKFFVQIAPTPGDYTIVSPVATLAGLVRASSGGNEDSQTSFAATTVTFVAAAGASKIGDSADFWSDGTNWYTRVFVDTAAAGTIS